MLKYNNNKRTKYNGQETSKLMEQNERKENMSKNR